MAVTCQVCSLRSEGRVLVFHKGLSEFFLTLRRQCIILRFVLKQLEHFTWQFKKRNTQTPGTYLQLEYSSQMDKHLSE